MIWTFLTTSLNESSRVVGGVLRVSTLLTVYDDLSREFKKRKE